MATMAPDRWIDVRKPEDITPSFEAATTKRVDALTVGNDW